MRLGQVSVAWGVTSQTLEAEKLRLAQQALQRQQAAALEAQRLQNEALIAKAKAEGERRAALQAASTSTKSIMDPKVTELSPSPAPGGNSGSTTQSARSAWPLFAITGVCFGAWLLFRDKRPVSF